MKRSKTLYIVVHGAATKPSQNIRAEDVRQWHIDRGWIDIGYHWFIGRDGKIEQGRDMYDVGAHAQGYNNESVAICMAGGIDLAGNPAMNYTGFQMRSLYALLRFNKSIFPDAIIQGHRDFPGVKKDCPCFDVQEWCRTVGLA